MLFSSEIEGDLCAMLEVSAWDFILNNTLAKEWMMRTAYPVCISTMFNLQKLSHGYDYKKVNNHCIPLYQTSVFSILLISGCLFLQIKESFGPYLSPVHLYKISASQLPWQSLTCLSYPKVIS